MSIKALHFVVRSCGFCDDNLAEFCNSQLKCAPFREHLSGKKATMLLYQHPEAAGRFFSVEHYIVGKMRDAWST